MHPPMDPVGTVASVGIVDHQVRVFKDDPGVCHTIKVIGILSKGVVQFNRHQFQTNKAIRQEEDDGTVVDQEIFGIFLEENERQGKHVD